MEQEQVFKKILFLTDGSVPSLSAQELTILLAKKLGSEVTVFHVVTHELMRSGVQDFLVRGTTFPESSDVKPAVILGEESAWAREAGSPGAHYSETIASELTDVYRQEGEDIASDAAQVFKEEGIQADSKVVEHKNVAEAVIDEVEMDGYDLIVMGRSGRKEKEVRLGSVAEKVSVHADIPVLVAGEKTTISKILVPIDGSEGSRKALQCAAALAKKLGVGFTLLHVQESHIFGRRPDVAKAIGKGILDDATRKLKGVNFDQKMESGDPARTISSIAEKEDFDMLVLGATGHSRVERFLLGSVTHNVLHYTKHPVLIMK